MTKPLEPRNDASAVEIGEVIKNLANGTISKDDAARDIIRLTKRGGGGSVSDIDFGGEDDDNEKIVVVPDKDILTEAEGDLGNVEHYPLSSAYTHQAAAIMVSQWEKATSAGSTQTLEEFVREQAGKAMDVKKFFLLRLGEYCVSQCK